MPDKNLSEILDKLDTGQELTDYSILNQDLEMLSKIDRLIRITAIQKGDDDDE